MSGTEEQAQFGLLLPIIDVRSTVDRRTGRASLDAILDALSKATAQAYPCSNGESMIIWPRDLSRYLTRSMEKRCRLRSPDVEV